MSLIDFEYLVEIDNNPVIVFDHDGKILYLNANAEILLGYVKKREIFNLCLNNAPKEYGFNTIQLELHYGSFTFYSISISYINDDYIAIRLYYKPKIKHISRDTSKVETDLNKILNNSIVHFKISCDIDIRLLTDLDIPPTHTNQNTLSLLLRKILDSFKNSQFVNINMSLKIGEFIIIDEKRYNVISLSYISESRDKQEDLNIRRLAEDLSFDIYLNNKNVSLDIPLIKN